jgi:hypothetical protein
MGPLYIDEAVCALLGLDRAQIAAMTLGELAERAWGQGHVPRVSEGAEGEPALVIRLWTGRDRPTP